MEGFLLIDKPGGITSHDVVDSVRKITGEKRVGHAGTLDPFATGLLIVGVGRTATREMNKLSGLDKTYEAVFALGATSDTDDRTGVVKELKELKELEELKELTKERIETAMGQFVGSIKQVPPQYAAIKIHGKKMYELARRGQTVEAKPRDVTIKRFDLLEILSSSGSGRTPQNDRLKTIVECSSGTYIRALARDLGTSLGTGGYVEELRRTSIGPFDIKNALLLSTLKTFTTSITLKPLTTPSNIPLLPIDTFLAMLGS